MSVFKKNNDETPESKRLSSAIMAIFFFVVFVLSVVVCKDQLLGKTTDFYSLYDGSTTESIKKDTYVDIPVDAVIGNYAYTKHTTYFIPTGTDEHYILWLDDGSFISLKVKDKGVIATLDNITDKTWDVIDTMDEDGNYTKDLPIPVHMKGTIHTIDPEIKGYLDEALTEIGAADAGYAIHYVEIDMTSNQSSAWFQTCALLGLCILGVVFFIANNNDVKKQKAFANASAAASASVNTTMGDFSNDPVDEPYYGAKPETYSYGYNKNENDSNNPYGF